MKDYFLDYANGKIRLDEIPKTLTPIEKEHGKIYKVIIESENEKFAIKKFEKKYTNINLISMSRI